MDRIDDIDDDSDDEIFNENLNNTQLSAIISDSDDVISMPPPIKKARGKPLNATKPKLISNGNLLTLLFFFLLKN